MVEIKGDTVIFSSGRTAYANRGIVGISPELDISYGYDGGIGWPIPEFWKTSHPEWITDKTLTADDMRELADHMICLWTKFKETLPD